MKWKILHIIIAISLLVAGCSDNSTDERPDIEQPQQQEHELRLSMGMPQFQNDTRAAGDLPSGFSAYTYSKDNPIDQIVGFLVPTSTTTSTSTNSGKTYTCHFIHEEVENNKHVWTSKTYLSDDQYYFYGYMPNVSASSVTVTAATTETPATPAIITLTGLNAVMPDDICVIEGVKQYSGTTLPDMSDAIGLFGGESGYYNTKIDADNFYVLASHIYSALEINMKLDATYANLRKIKLRSITLTPYVANNQVANKINATITITHRGESDLETALNVSFTEYAGTTSTASTPAVLHGVEGEELTTDDKPFLACLCPHLSTDTKYVMETHYDVYDKEDNLIRENQSAQNTLTTLPQLTRGTKHVVNITVNPTYLYVLSDPDLDNPTFKISPSSDP